MAINTLISLPFGWFLIAVISLLLFFSPKKDDQASILVAVLVVLLLVVGGISLVLGVDKMCKLPQVSCSSGDAL